MEQNDKWVITGVNRLTKMRDDLSGPMPKEMAEERLQREIENRRYQRYQPYKALRVEKVRPVQLLIKFNEL